MQPKIKNYDNHEKRSNQVGPAEELVLLPTGKPHISFSELKNWSDCSYRHHLIYVKKLDNSKPSTTLDFGTAVHAAHEYFIKNRIINSQIAIDSLTSSWQKNNHAESLNFFIKKACDILLEIEEFYEKNFPNWQAVAAEYPLYETIIGKKIAFKGFIDAIIKVPGKNGKWIYWIIDVKTTQRGWFRDKRTDDRLKYQLGLYKKFWCQKNPDVDFKDVRCGFVLLKKDVPDGQHCELFKVSLGEVPIGRALKVVNNMLTAVSKGIALKNRDSCRYCEFKDTENCV